MPISPLAAMYAGAGGGLGGENAMMLGMDPALLEAQPEIQIGQGMMQQGLSTAPAYPLQALARVVQAGLGGALYKGGISDLARAYGNVPEAAAEALEAGHQQNNPAIAMLRSQNPMVRMMGLQLLQKTVPIQAEGYNVNPNQVHYQGTAPAAAGSPVQGAAATGAEETAKAQVKYGNLIPGQSQGAPQQAPAEQKPVPTDHGTVLPPPTNQVLPGSPAQAETMLPSWQKTTEEWTKSLAPSQLAMQRLNTIAQAFKSIESGTFTTEKAQLAAALKAVGLDASGILGDPAKAQLALHENYAETLQQLKAATSRFTQQEFRITSENKEHPNIQPAANLQMLAEDMGSLQQSVDVATDWNKAAKVGWKNPQSYEAEYLKANKLPDYVNRFKDQIGPLKGMPGNNGAVPRSSALGSTPAVAVQPPETKAGSATQASPKFTRQQIEAEMKRRGLIPQ